MRKFTLQTGLIAVSLLATSIASANIGFGQSLDNFTFDGDYQGSFVYDGTSYGQGYLANTLDIEAIDNAEVTNNFFYRTNSNFEIYRIYRQNHSAVVGNAVRGNADRSFVRDIAGENPVQGTVTKSDVLPNGANYNYSGVTFNHIQGVDGTLTYNISVDNTGKATGSGSIAGVTGNRPSLGAFTLSGNLAATEITNLGDRLGIKDGATSLTYTDSTGSYTWNDAKYDIGVYGSNAEEVAGALHGGTLEDTIGGYGIAGKR